MMKKIEKNILAKIFEEFKKNKIDYCIRSRYKHLPDTLDGGDVDVLVNKKDMSCAEKILKEKDFFFYPYTEPNKFYFKYDRSLGLILFDILPTYEMIQKEEHNGISVPKEDIKVPNRKKLHQKAYTGIRRRLYFMFSGPIIVFEGPDGSGKTTNAEALYSSLKKFPMKKEFIHFATKFKDKKPSILKRFFSRISALLRVYYNVFLGRMTITDRYLYLTFRKKPFLKKILWKIIPEPDLLFIVKASPSIIRKRKKGQRDLLSKEMISELYTIYSEGKTKKRIFIDTSKSLEENIETVINETIKVSTGYFL